MKRFSSRLTRGPTKGGLSLTAPKMSSTSSSYTAIGSAFWFEHLNLNLIVVVVVAAGGFILDPLQRERAAATTVFSHLLCACRQSWLIPASTADRQELPHCHQ
jgi:hypothetical protein